jgi:very-short-patch-repair endonuclease
LAALAARQHGVVTAAQLKRLGLADSTIKHRADFGRLHRVHRGVYAVGHAKLSQQGEWMAAVLAAGEVAVLASLSAAVLWQAWRRRLDTIHVLAPTKRRARAGFEIRTTRSLHPSDHTIHDGIPVTTMARTLVDLTDVLTVHQLANVIHEASFRNRFDRAATRAAVERAHGRRHLQRLEQALTQEGAGTRSELEDRFLEAFPDLPRPRVNTRVHGLEVDFAWPSLIVEIDGSGHERRRTKRQDARRDAILARAGYAILRLGPGDF